MKSYVINKLEELISLLSNFKVLADVSLGELLRTHGLLSEHQVRLALREQKLLRRRRFGQIVVEKGWVSEEQLNIALAYKLGIPAVKINTYQFTEQALKVLPHSVVKQCRVVPLGEINGRLIVATDCPFDSKAIEVLRFNTHLPVDVVLAAPEEIGRLLQRYLSGLHEDKALADLNAEMASMQIQDDGGEVEAQNKPIVQLLNNIIDQGVESGASDINLRPGIETVSLYYRLDGKMTHVKDLSKQLLSALVSRIKIIGKMDIAERRLPQDGHAVLHVGDKRIDLRISVIPTLRGESVVIRILDKHSGLLSLDDLGIDVKGVSILKKVMQSHQGMVLVTGPTGAGKSTTLYSLINHIQASHRHILTIEDPVEYEIEGIEQVQIMSKRDFGFAAALRQFLRHDPDVIMVGEIRDNETAQIANKAALTGHVVLSTLHTRDAISTVQRLYDMGIEPCLLASTLNCVVTQRLVRRICPRCRCEDKAASRDVVQQLGAASEVALYKGTGCYHCHYTGYKGRLGVAEVLAITPEFADLIARQATRLEMIALAEAQGMQRLFDAGLSMASKGMTTLEEVLAIRVD